MSLEIKKKKMELARVRLAREELQLKIEERLDEIERIKRHIAVQVEKETELENQIKGME